MYFAGVCFVAASSQAVSPSYTDKADQQPQLPISMDPILGESHTLCVLTRLINSRSCLSPWTQYLVSHDPNRDSRIYLRILHHARCDKICHQSTPRHQTCIVVKTCIMASHVSHSKRGTVIYDCLVSYARLPL